MQSPNILFIQVDQLTALSLRAYGNTICHSPNIDSLAEQGVVFENAYCNFALCSPSRFSMATGQLCSTIGAYDNAAEMPASIPTYAHYLTNLGYQTALAGKMHFIGPDQHHGFERRLTPDLYPADFSWVPNWGHEGDRDTNDPRSVLISGVCERSTQIDFDEAVTYSAVRHLYDMARSDDARPFFLQVSYTHPHEPYLCRKKYWDLYENVEIPLPTVPPLPEDKHDAHSLRLLKDFGMFNVKFDDEDILRARRAYYGSISYIDEMVGQLISTLKETGQYDNTAIVFTSDHGDMQGERGMWFKKHFFEAASRVPLLMFAPWIKPERISEMVSLVDLVPTFNNLATDGQWDDAFEPIEGNDLTVLLGQGNPPPARTVYAEYLAEATLAPIFMIRRGDFKYISSRLDPALLFNVTEDPNELNNLAATPAFADRVDAFEAEIAEKWDSEALTEAIICSQKRRRFVLEAQKRSLIRPRWNHDEKPGEAVIWYRGEGSYNEWAFDYLPPLKAL